MASTSSSSSSGVSFTDYFLASLLTGSTVMIMHGILEGVSLLDFGGEGGTLIRFIMNLIVSAASGFVAILLVDMTGLMG